MRKYMYVITSKTCVYRCMSLRAKHA